MRHLPFSTRERFRFHRRQIAAGGHIDVTFAGQSGYVSCMPTKKEDLPDTLKRSPAKARRTYAKALDAAHAEYGDEERAHRTAFAALKHSFKKVGDHWEPKANKGPSDPQAAKGGQAARQSKTPTGGGKQVGTTKAELMQQAQQLDIRGRSKMSKDQLVKAVAKAKP